MKTLLIRIFALAVLSNSILVFAASSPRKDDKTPVTCSPSAADTAQSAEDGHCDNRKEKKMKKKGNEHKEGENYPGYGIYG